MKDTTFLLPEGELPTLAAQYQYQAQDGYTNIGKEIRRFKLGSLYESGGAGAISSVTDYIRFLEGLRTHKLLREETLAQMTRDHLKDPQRELYWPGPDGYGYGLGVRVPFEDAAGRTDFGWGGAAGAFLAIDPDKKLSVYYAQHVLASPNGALRKDLIEAVKLDLGFDAFTTGMWQGKGGSSADSLA